MWALLILVFCASSLAQSNETTSFDQDLGPLHLYTKSADFPNVPTRILKREDRRATRKAKSYMNYVRNHPKLNPLKVRKLVSRFQIPDVNFLGHVTFRDLVVNGIKDFSIVKLEVHVKPPTIDFNITIPQLTVTADFRLKGACGRLPAVSYGNFSAVIKDLGLMGTLDFIKTTRPGRLSPESVYQLDNAEVIVDLKNLHIKVFMNRYAREFKLILGEFFVTAEHIIDDNNFLRIILKSVNQQLENVMSEQIKRYLLGNGRLDRNTSSPERGSNSKEDEDTTNSRKYGK